MNVQAGHHCGEATTRLVHAQQLRHDVAQCCILHTGVETLAPNRMMHVRGVAGQGNPPITIGRRLSRHIVNLEIQRRLWIS